MASFNDHLAKFKQIFQQRTVVKQPQENFDNWGDSVDICCGYKFCKECYPETNEDILKKENYRKDNTIKQLENETDTLRDKIHFMV